ncbi:nitrous oxide-stimulated promoter family protein [Psychromonas sp. 14N.309.X.WAT.B.A12]|uniref:nitrous oxide-stimulated promoter family protein n=1 Tax=Psychromonas sp. 14N.309.X.WAT.B.A12 TaxID=2998322 RepID=UPI0025AFAF7E|nr:nitrous oxide-stimulated promoter family protein [Psychromonas sp. 14N.309.X.WAT.B.A12]MDN2662189.1 nitrous oxide-stimulated promoter family protein [Psychromonas sp. 14N.309.X.WAT.B.A12]
MSGLHLLSGKLALEFKTIQMMIKIYCKHHHHSSIKINDMCNECADFIRYAYEKLDRCPYGKIKPTCNKCPIHCYKTEIRSQAKKIMLFSGPRMIFYHPLLAIRHLLSERNPVPSSVPKEQSNRHIRIKRIKN